MRSFNSLSQLLVKLNDTEKSYLIKILHSSLKDNSKSIQLVKLLIENSSYNAINIQKKIYGKSNPIAFRKLTDRLKVKAMDVLLLDVNIKMGRQFERSSVILDLRKKLIQSDILSMRGLRDDADSLCKKIINCAEKYELFDIISQALIIRQKFVTLRKKVKESQKITFQTELYELKHKSMVRCQLIYNSMLNKITNAKLKSDYLLDLNYSVVKLEKEMGEYPSDIVKYYLNILQTELLQSQLKYIEAENHLITLLTLLNKRSIYSESRMGSVLLNLSSNCIYLLKFKQGLEYAILSKKYFKNSTVNLSLSEEHSFLCLFYTLNYQEAYIISQKMSKLPNTNNIDLNYLKWNFYSAYILFALKEYVKCLEILVDKDVIGVEAIFYKRVLIIQCRIELEDFEIAGQLIENLDKYFKRISKNYFSKGRLALINKILLKLNNANFDFEYVFKQRMRHFDLLCSRQQPTSWIPKSFELIPFERWFKNRVANI